MAACSIVIGEHNNVCPTWSAAAYVRWKSIQIGVTYSCLNWLTGMWTNLENAAKTVAQQDEERK